VRSAIARDASALLASQNSTLLRPTTTARQEQHKHALRALQQLHKLAASDDWRGVAALEFEARSAAAAAQAEAPSDAFFVYNTLGNAHQALGDFGKAVEYHTQCQATPSPRSWGPYKWIDSELPTRLLGPKPSSKPALHNSYLGTASSL